MKLANMFLIGAASLILGGCAGYSAYVPNAGTGSTNNAICTPIVYSGPSSFLVDINTGDFSLDFSFLLSSFVSPETATFSFDNLPPGISVETFANNPIVLTDQSGDVRAELLLENADADVGFYTVTLRMTRPGCADYTVPVMFDVADLGS